MIKYYPKSQVKIGLTSKPNEFKLAKDLAGGDIPPQFRDKIKDGFYLGSYIATSDGKFFMGDTLLNSPFIEIIKAWEDKEQGSGEISLIDVKKQKLEKLLSSDSVGSFYNYDEDYSEIRNIPNLKEAPVPPPSFKPIITDEEFSKGNVFRYFAKLKKSSKIIEISEENYLNLKNKNHKFQWELYEPFRLKWTLFSSIQSPYEMNKSQVRILESQGCTGLGVYLKNQYMDPLT